MSVPAQTADRGVPQRSFLSESLLAPLRRLGWASATLPFLVLLGVFFVAPLVDFIGGYDFNAAAWHDILHSSGDLSTVSRTLEIAGETTLICGVISYFYVAALLRTRGVVRTILLFATVVPFFTSILVRSYAWIIVLGYDGPMRRALNWLLGGGQSAPQLLYNRTGLLIGMVHVLLPLFILPLYAVMTHVPGELSKAARTLGANRAETFLRVDLPLSFPGAAAGALLVFITALGFFVTPSLLGGFGDTMLAQLIDQQLRESVNLNAAAVLATLLIAAVLLAVLLFRLVYPLELLFVQGHETGASGKVRSRRRPELPHVSAAVRLRVTRAVSRLPWRFLSNVVALLTVVYFMLPLLVVVPVSFSGDAYLDFPPHSYSLRWYRQVVGDSGWRDAALHSLMTGAVATAIAGVVGLLLAFALVRARLRSVAKGGLVLLSVLPVIVPVIVIAIGTFLWFLNLHLAGSIPALGASHALLGVPYLAIVVTSALRDLDPALERAARSLGAHPWTALRSVTLPLVKTAIFVGLFFAFLQSWDELLIARAVTDASTATLPVMLWAGANQEISPALAVVSTVSLAVTLLVAVVALQLRRPKAVPA